mmetsp:Transcript_34527/g.99069  ORF Transcript_34527/g.99069 Transcript_34527/m.99069 type:complete len:212 (+) Transcript_34527:63-698(+)
MGDLGRSHERPQARGLRIREDPRARQSSPGPPQYSVRGQLPRRRPSRHRPCRVPRRRPDAWPGGPAKRAEEGPGVRHKAGGGSGGSGPDPAYRGRHGAGDRRGEGAEEHLVLRTGVLCRAPEMGRRHDQGPAARRIGPPLVRHLQRARGHVRHDQLAPQRVRGAGVPPLVPAGGVRPGRGAGSGLRGGGRQPAGCNGFSCRCRGCCIRQNS